MAGYRARYAFPTNACRPAPGVWGGCLPAISPARPCRCRELLRQGGGEAHWLRAQLRTPLINVSSLPHIEALTMRVRIDDNAPIDAAFFNSIPLDLSKDFYPFGEAPKLADTFYLASNVAFSKPGARITCGIELSAEILSNSPVCGPF